MGKEVNDPVVVNSSIPPICTVGAFVAVPIVKFDPGVILPCIKLTLGILHDVELLNTTPLPVLLKFNILPFTIFPAPNTN